MYLIFNSTRPLNWFLMYELRCAVDYIETTKSERDLNFRPQIEGSRIVCVILARLRAPLV